MFRVYISCVVHSWLAFATVLPSIPTSEVPGNPEPEVATTNPNKRKRSSENDIIAQMPLTKKASIDPIPSPTTQPGLAVESSDVDSNAAIVSAAVQSTSPGSNNNPHPVLASDSKGADMALQPAASVGPAARLSASSSRRNHLWNRRSKMMKSSIPRYPNRRCDLPVAIPCSKSRGKIV